MADYKQAALELKARLDAKAKRKADLDAFFEALKSSIAEEAAKANAALAQQHAPSLDLREESVGEPTVELTCRMATCKVSQDREAPSIGAVIHGETGEKTVTFLILAGESPISAQRVSLAPATEPRLSPEEIASTIVEEFMAGVP